LIFDLSECRISHIAVAFVCFCSKHFLFRFSSVRKKVNPPVRETGDTRRDTGALDHFFSGMRKIAIRAVRIGEIRGA
jgi:hypothetical protein